MNKYNEIAKKDNSKNTVVDKLFSLGKTATEILKNLQEESIVEILDIPSSVQHMKTVIETLRCFAAKESLKQAKMQEGFRRAQEAGHLKGRRSTIDNSKFYALHQMWKEGEITKTEFAQKIGLSRSGLYRAIERFEKTGHV